MIAVEHLPDWHTPHGPGQSQSSPHWLVLVPLPELDDPFVHSDALDGAGHELAHVSSVTVPPVVSGSKLIVAVDPPSQVASSHTSCLELVNAK